MVRVSMGCYTNHSNNYGTNSMVVHVNDLSVWFSYDTIIAFSTPKTGLVCSENNWGPTTGKHLNCIQPNKKKRISHDKFIEKLKKMHTLEEFIEVL